MSDERIHEREKLLQHDAPIELLEVVKLAANVAVATSASQTMMLTDMIFVGHLGRNELAVAGLATSVFNFFWFAILGFCSILDTLGSQAHGAGDAPGVRTWAFVTAVGACALCVPTTLGLVYAGGLARVAMRQPPETAEAVGRFCKLLIPGLVPGVLATVATKYLQVG